MTLVSAGRRLSRGVPSDANVAQPAEVVDPTKAAAATAAADDASRYVAIPLAKKTDDDDDDASLTMGILVSAKAEPEE